MFHSTMMNTGYSIVYSMPYVNIYYFFYYAAMFRLNKDPPNMSFKRKEKGGINLQTTVCTYLNWKMTVN